MLFGNPVTTTEVQEFVDYVQNLLLNEITWNGDYYTLTYRQIRDDKIYSSLDTTFGNDLQMLKWGHLYIDYDLLAI